MIVYEPVSIDLATARMLADSMRFFERVGPSASSGAVWSSRAGDGLGT